MKIFNAFKKNCAAAAIYFLLPSSALAGGWTTAGNISDLVASDTDMQIIGSAITSASNCASPNWYRLPTNSANYQSIATIILTAKAQGKTVRFWINQCDPSGMALIVAVWIN